MSHGFRMISILFYVRNSHNSL
ncbi:MAG: hypothetical protein HN580_02480 [Deltaproteobacteria bacterium]|nr:hypothetical protein [Deltaproteobacteria bacterium]MBT4089912.1 hypothetical protein [Deltaproteobacteria bacterium]MBT4269340.1 hypothetical protein [Deltaproteobacteria bacterium]MBT4639453.1 hypothetical protein [Deltaproteobacteria bacterium]MBT6503168.1 hypothetical protein [Deltaproteobacteria bacterium]